MAEAAILAAVKTLGELVVQKTIFLQGVEEQVKWLKDELERMQCFLKDAAVKQADNERIHKWISDIREVAQDANDVMETFILKVDTPRRSKGSFGRWLYMPNNLYHLDRVGEEIKSIQAKLQEIERSRVRYGILSLGDGTDSSRGEIESRRRLSPWAKDRGMVGLEEDVELLLDKAILDEREGLSIATIVGMGGIGKSTLAKKVYNHATVANRFSNRAWVVVSSEFRPNEVIKELMLQLVESKEDKLKVVQTMEKLSLPSLQQMFHERLQGKRYLIVLDDVWENKHWESLASVFPVEDRGSRLLLTSRRMDITKHSRFVHKMKLLNTEESWELFINNAFLDNKESKCPEDLEGTGKEILRKCNGLPLAITVAGGLLINKSPSKRKWENVLKEINSQSDNSVSEILELSYRNLSPELKSCFLCLGFFKEDATIRAKKLVHVWITQGLVQEERGWKTVEEIGRSYLDELINRNMVQVKDLSKDESVKNCYVHDLLRDLSITKAKEEISFEILRDNENSQSLEKARHRAIYYSQEPFTYSASKNKHLRSLYFHGDGDTFNINPSYLKSFELLRILDFEDFYLRSLPDTIGALTGLRYLGLRNTGMVELLPSSLGRLKKLEVLDIAKNTLMQVPNVLWKLDSLRHLYMSHHICIGDVMKAEIETLKIHTLKNLLTLAYVNEDDLTLEHLTKLSSLRELGICVNSFDLRVSKVCSSLENLVSLSIRGDQNYLPRVERLSTLRGLTHLKMHGQLSKLPSAIDFPPNLRYLTLRKCVFHEDPMPVLEKLPKLLSLKLDRAYEGEKVVVSDEGFPRLEVLIMRRMWRLKDLQVGKPGGMPALKRLELYECYSLKGRLSQELRLVTTILK